jgi:phosphoribosyl-AMP cyclohydrolase / phosphoribosyl-ATP pyrophosphohydrolase
MSPLPAGYDPGDGLVPGVVQDAATARVLMLGYLDREALAATLDTGQVHFHSRSRDALWRKGETSGNTLEVVDVATDCDGDALLIRARPAGPTCHTGAVSCFDAAVAGNPPAPQGFASLEDLWATIASRATERPGGSYTVRLLEGGVDTAGRKVLEEAGEVLLAAKDHAAGTGADDRLAEEAADLVYHLLVLLAERRMAPDAVLAVLARRAG